MNIYTNQEFDKIRLAGRLTKEALQHISSKISIGMTTLDIDIIFAQFLHGTGGKAACKGYHGFPANLCVSINDEACHGIPISKRQIQDGDIVSVDAVVELDGYHGDSCVTVGMGNITAQNQALIDLSYKALYAGVDSVKEGMLLSEIGKSIGKIVHGTGINVITEYCGHGVGRKMHEKPLILHYNHVTTQRIINGMCFTIEPILTLGNGKTYVGKDDWTVYTKDKAFCSQFEHTLGIVNGKVEIFT